MPTFAVDHGFPESVLTVVKDYLPFGVEMLRSISSDLIRDKEDWEVLLAISQRGYDGLITTDYAMLELPRELVVVDQTRLTVVAIEAAGDNPLVAIGQLLVQARPITNSFDPKQPQIIRITRSRAVRPIPARGILGEIASRQGISIQQLFNQNRLTPAELTTPVI